MKILTKSVVIVILGLVMAVPVFAVNSITWATKGATLIYENDGITPLFGSALEAGGAYLVQLIYAGDNGSIDPVDVADMNEYGVSGDDVYVARGWIGGGKAGTDGAFVGMQANVSSQGSNKYYIRAWQGASRSVGTGYMPSDSSTYYGNSALYTFQDSPSPGNEFFIDSSFSTTLQAVPEPATVALALAGLGLLVFRRFRKKS